MLSSLVETHRFEGFRERRERLGLSQREAAEKLGISRSTVLRLDDERPVSAHLARRVERALMTLESPADTLEREIAEDTGRKISDALELAVFSRIRRSSDPDYGTKVLKQYHQLKSLLEQVTGDAEPEGS